MSIAAHRELTHTVTVVRLIRKKVVKRWTVVRWRVAWISTKLRVTGLCGQEKRKNKMKKEEGFEMGCLICVCVCVCEFYRALVMALCLVCT